MRMFSAKPFLIMLIIFILSLSIEAQQIQPQSGAPGNMNPFANQQVNPNLNLNNPNSADSRTQRGARRTLPPRTNRTEPAADVDDPTSNRLVPPSLSAPAQPQRTPQSTAAPSQGTKGRKYSNTVKMNSQLKIQRNPILYMTTENAMVQLNEPLQVEIKLSSPEEITFDSFAFALQYNPDEFLPVEPHKVQDQWIPLQTIVIRDVENESATENPDAYLFQDDQFQAENIVNRVDHNEGLIHFSASGLSKSLNGSRTIAKLTLLSIRRNPRAKLAFHFGKEQELAAQDYKTYLLNNETDLLGSKVDPLDGTISLDIAILGDRSTDKQEMENEEKPLTLRFVPSQTEFDAGDEFEVDVVLDNPGKRVIDAANLLLAYNTNVLKVIDSNRSEAGTNIDDRKQKKTFGFDFLLHNQVDAKRGLIDYRIRTNRAHVRGEGVIATIHFKAIKPTTKTTLRVLVSEKGDIPTTSITYRKKDLLGEPDNPWDNIQTASVTIRHTVASSR